MIAPRLPDLDRLSSAEKDALIVSLWETVKALDGQRPSVKAGDAGNGAPSSADSGGQTETLRQRIRATSASHRAQHRPSASRHWLSRLLDYRPLQVLAGLIALGFLADAGAGWYQRRQVAERQAAAQRLEQAAFGGMFMELVRAGYAPGDGAYKATLRLEKTGYSGTLYVLQNPPRVFVQTGLTWQEVPSRAPQGKPWGVIQLDGSVDTTVLFDGDIKGWSELMPGYMHVQLQFDQLISVSSDPGEDIVERKNRFYFYLKPRGADDEEIKRRTHFSGPPPAFIPMPPH